MHQLCLWDPDHRYSFKYTTLIPLHMTTFDALMAGFGIILGVELVLTISNVVTSYILPDGATMEEYLDNKFDWSSA